jgi:hypothetical protein
VDSSLVKDFRSNNEKSGYHCTGDTEPIDDPWIIAFAIAK